jgi:hypothetical protein
MTRLTDRGELRLYLREHNWWWKWPLVATTVAVWIGAMILFVSPWQSNASTDDLETRPAPTDDVVDDVAGDDDAAPGDLTIIPDLRGATDTTGVADDETPATSVEEAVDAAEVEALSPEPTVEEPPAVVAAEATDSGDAGRRRPATTEPPPPAPSPLDPNIFTTTTVRSTTTTTTIRRTTITVPRPITTTTIPRPTTTTTTIRPTTTTTTAPPPPPPPPTTAAPTTTAAPPPPPPTTAAPPPTTAAPPPPIEPPPDDAQ